VTADNFRVGDWVAAGRGGAITVVGIFCQDYLEEDDESIGSIVQIHANEEDETSFVRVGSDWEIRKATPNEAQRGFLHKREETFVCASCGEDFREVGFWEAQNVVEYTIYQFDKDSGLFEQTESASNAVEGTFHVYCQGCEALVREDQIQPLLDLRE
jgi:hypothetical protein